MEDEKKLLQQIYRLFNELKNEARGVVNAYSVTEPNAYSFSRKASLLREKVIDLHEKFKPKYLTQYVIDQLNYTLNKEVRQVVHSYKECKKKGAAKVRYGEFVEYLKTAIERIEVDICVILEMAEKA